MKQSKNKIVCYFIHLLKKLSFVFSPEMMTFVIRLQPIGLVKLAPNRFFFRNFDDQHVHCSNWSDRNKMYDHIIIIFKNLRAHIDVISFKTLLQKKSMISLKWVERNRVSLVSLCIIVIIQLANVCLIFFTIWSMSVHNSLFSGSFFSQFQNNDQHNWSIKIELTITNVINISKVSCSNTLKYFCWFFFFFIKKFGTFW